MGFRPAPCLPGAWRRDWNLLAGLTRGPGEQVRGLCAGQFTAERLAVLAGQRPWWSLVEPTPRWIRARIGDELIADSRRALLHVQYGRGALPRSFLPTYYVPVDDVLPAALVDPVEAETGLTVWAVAAAGLRADDAAARPQAADAVAVCADCPVRAECLGRSQLCWRVGQHGVWGGVVPAERAMLRQ
jgi:uncharacterized protein (DUF427 family)